jgi:hypothetical protein
MMSVETNLKIRQYSSGEERPLVDERFIRRAFTLTQEMTLSLTSGTAQDIETALSTIEYVLVRRTGDTANITLKKNLSPDAWVFDDTFLTWGLSGCSSLSVEADADTEVHVFIGGS